LCASVVQATNKSSHSIALTGTGSPFALSVHHASTVDAKESTSATGRVGRIGVTDSVSNNTTARRTRLDTRVADGTAIGWRGENRTSI